MEVIFDLEEKKKELKLLEEEIANSRWEDSNKLKHVLSKYNKLQKELEKWEELKEEINELSEWKELIEEEKSIFKNSKKDLRS